VLEQAVHDDAPRELKKPTLHVLPVDVMVVLVTVCDVLTVSTQGSVLAMKQEPDVTVVPGVTPSSVVPTVRKPTEIAEMVSVVPVIAPVTLAAPEPTGQNEPAGHDVPVVSPVAQ